MSTCVTLVKGWRLTAELRIARAHAIKRAESFAADKEVPIGVHVECSVCGLIGNNDRSLPGDPAVGRPLELHAAAATVSAVAGLILKSVTWAVGLIDREPLLVAPSASPLGCSSVQDWPPLVERYMFSQNV